MDKLLKYGIAGICISAITLALIVIAPSPASKQWVVVAAPTFDNNTAIKELRVDNQDYLQITFFTENGTTSDVDIGENVCRLHGVVYIHSDYASDATEANANTRVHMLIKNPSDVTKYDDYLDNWAGGVEQQGDVWQVTKRDNTFDNFLLTEGTWTITTRYEVWA